MAIRREPKPVEDGWLEQTESKAVSAEGRGRWRSFEGDSRWRLQCRLYSTGCRGFKEHIVMILAVRADLAAQPSVRTYVLCTVCRW